jgi:hypothetical protein
VEANLFTTREAFADRRAACADADNTFGWWLLFDHEALSFADVPKAISGGGFAAGARSTFISQPGRHCFGMICEVDLLGAPFGLLLVQIGALALFFLIDGGTGPPRRAA